MAISLEHNTLHILLIKLRSILVLFLGYDWNDNYLECYISSMEQSPSWEAGSFLAIKKYLHN
jgi:hypothetical protein